MDNRIRSWLLGLICVVLFSPMANQGLHIITSGELKGGFKSAVDPLFTFDSWFDGTFQQQKSQYFNDATGFRSDLVRLNNQIDYTFFDKCHSAWTLKGKDGYLFQDPYIKAYYGKDFMGSPYIREKVRKLKAIQDTLGRLGKSVILVYAPSKASSYPEYFPNNRVEKTKDTTNYQVYRRLADSFGVNQVDFEAWFLSLKNKSKEPIFSKQGIHWTMYGAIMAGDSLMRYVEQLRGIKMAHPDWSEMVHTDVLTNGDDDVAAELNLIYPVAHETLAYPIIKEVADTTKPKINVIYIGDSYAFKMAGFGIIKCMNRQCEYWGYYDEVHDLNSDKFTYIKNYDVFGAISTADCVILEYTLFNLGNLGNGFIEAAYNHYFTSTAR